MRSRRGAALLTAVGLMVLISIISLERTLLARQTRLTVANVVERAQLEAVATAGVEQARGELDRLLRSGAMQSLRNPARVMDAWDAADGRALESTLAKEYRYRVEMHDAGMRLQLNAATQAQLRTLMLALGVDARRADHLSAAIGDWRDPDQLRRVNGAERSDYLAAGRAMLPDDGPFARVDQLRFVMGMTDSLYRLLAPQLTVFGDGKVDLNAAPRPVLLTLPGISEEATSVILHYRQRGARVSDLNLLAQDLSPAARDLLRASLLQLQASAALQPRQIHVASDAWRVGSAMHVRVDAIISRDDEGRVIWRRVSP